MTARISGRKDNNMSEQIKVSNGTKTYDLVNEEGKVLGQLTFNPSDTNILERHAEVIRQLDKMKVDFSKSVRKTTITEDLEEIDRIVYEKIDYLLNADVSKTLFSVMGPFSLLANGQFYVEHVLDVLGKVIQKDGNAKAKKINDKIKKYTAKYEK